MVRLQAVLSRTCSALTELASWSDPSHRDWRTQSSWTSIGRHAHRLASPSSVAVRPVARCRPSRQRCIVEVWPAWHSHGRPMALIRCRRQHWVAALGRAGWTRKKSLGRTPLARSALSALDAWPTSILGRGRSATVASSSRGRWGAPAVIEPERSTLERIAWQRDSGPPLPCIDGLKGDRESRLVCFRKG